MKLFRRIAAIAAAMTMAVSMMAVSASASANEGEITLDTHLTKTTTKETANCSATNNSDVTRLIIAQCYIRPTGEIDYYSGAESHNSIVASPDHGTNSGSVSKSYKSTDIVHYSGVLYNGNVVMSGQRTSKTKDVIVGNL